MISDPAALQYIFMKSGYKFTKQRDRTILVKLIFGRGVAWADGRF
jgi:hypothetical protein